MDDNINEVIDVDDALLAGDRRQREGAPPAAPVPRAPLNNVLKTPKEAAPFLRWVESEDKFRCVLCYPNYARLNVVLFPPQSDTTGSTEGCFAPKGDGYIPDAAINHVNKHAVIKDASTRARWLAAISKAKADATPITIFKQTMHPNKIVILNQAERAMLGFAITFVPFSKFDDPVFKFCFKETLDSAKVGCAKTAKKRYEQLRDTMVTQTLKKHFPPGTVVSLVSTSAKPNSMR
jgi:hypothetical protein